ncbi:hypothetical protein [Euzebya tangerina]|uniref:copper amine oxidase n=1 Tax=Euzebya tangerina TaxID=591198 RepID=UPI000E31E9B5|nr:hypothetical protein [Euzebya tangerina]
MPRRITRAGVIGLVAAGVLLIAVSGSTQPPTPGQHNEHSRFTTQDAPYPPQPRDATNIRPVQPVTFATASATPDAIAAAASADPAVQAELGPDAELLGVETVDPKDGEVSHRVGWFDTAANETVEAVVVEGSVTEVVRTAASEWQPPLSAAEGDTAIAIGREHWGERAAGLQGFVMHTMETDGSYPDRRLAYVTFAEHVDARPQLLTWVDLSSGTVERSREDDASGPAPAEPTHAMDTSFLGFGDGPGDGTPRQGMVEWNGWSFVYDVSGRNDGISLNDVTYQDVPIMDRASMPSMTVFYDDDACGPFVDRLGGELFAVEWADDAEIVLREFEQDGQQWLELGILDILGEYVLYQNYYIGEDGQIDAHTFAKGLQCVVDHVHYPFWRFDFDINGAADDVISRRAADGFLVDEPVEFDRSAAEAVEHDWRVRDRATGVTVDLTFDDGTWNVPGVVIPEVLYDTNRVYGRQYANSEAGTWRWPALDYIPGNEEEPIDGQDVVLWYRGFLPHTADEGPDLWHSTGVRLQVHFPVDHFVRQQ